MFLIEIRANTGRIEELKRTVKFDKYFCVKPRGISRSLGILWNKKLEVEVLEENHNYIHTIYCEKGDLFF